MAAVAPEFCEAGAGGGNGAEARVLNASPGTDGTNPTGGHGLTEGATSPNEMPNWGSTSGSSAAAAVRRLTARVECGHAGTNRSTMTQKSPASGEQDEMTIVMPQTPQARPMGSLSKERRSHGLQPLPGHEPFSGNPDVASR